MKKAGYDVILSRPRGALCWLRLYRLYRRSFPAQERKPFGIILDMHRKGITDVWCIRAEGRPVGMAATINGDDLILLDYFAVDGAYRGRGIGTAALACLRRHYRGKGLFVEIESAYEESPNKPERLRRKQFYLGSGMRQFCVMARVFGVKMELLGWDCDMDFARYHAFYRDYYGPAAAANIRRETHPEEGAEDDQTS